MKVAQPAYVYENHSIVHFKMITFMACELYLSLKKCSEVHRRNDRCEMTCFSLFRSRGISYGRAPGPQPDGACCGDGKSGGRVFASPGSTGFASQERPPSPWGTSWRSLSGQPPRPADPLQSGHTDLQRKLRHLLFARQGSTSSRQDWDLAGLLVHRPFA